MDITSTPYYALLREGLDKNRADTVERAEGFPVTLEDYLGLPVLERMRMARDILRSYSRVSPGSDEHETKTVTQEADDNIQLKLGAQWIPGHYPSTLDFSGIEVSVSARDTRTEVTSGLRIGKLSFASYYGRAFVQLYQKNEAGISYLGSELDLEDETTTPLIGTLDEVICDIITSEIARDRALGTIATASTTS